MVRPEEKPTLDVEPQQAVHLEDGKIGIVQEVRGDTIIVSYFQGHRRELECSIDDVMGVIS